MKNVFIIFTALVFFSSCGSGDEKSKSLQDSLKQDSVVRAEKIKQVAEEKKKNIYLIEPPDTSYTGEYLDKYENGNVKFQGFFRFGKRHGQWMAFYANGILWSECFYDKAVRSGANNVYYENGKLRYKGWYKNDLRDSVWIFYDVNGVVTKQVTYKNDEEISSK